MRCGCTLSKRMRIWLKPKIKFPPLEEYKPQHYKYAKIRGERERELILNALWWGQHVRDPMPISYCGDTIIVADQKRIIIATIRKELAVKDK